MNKIGYKTYFNERLKQVQFHDRLTYPLYVQVTFERKPIYFKSYYFELFSKPKYFLEVPGVGTKAPSIEEIIERENEVINFIMDKHKEDFSLDLFKRAYAYYSRDLCDLMEAGFIKYLHTFFWDEGLPYIADIVKLGAKNVVAYNIVRDLKKVVEKPLYERLIDHSFAYSTPYLPVYGFMKQTKRWPMEILTVMEFAIPATMKSMMEYIKLYYPKMPFADVMVQVSNIAYQEGIDKFYTV
ncbi:hypothetical protein [Pedobacter sp. L105]|uniref:hypothetical protein n=1 Tax=Pedobacter sp. L105 TaxID=1641871 RepID=UPI00131BDAB9|nr:hypothetical protein [Pedobacter sp. L105]